jgi:sugar/nucleoside kinase (ribokinase family)
MTDDIRRVELATPVDLLVVGGLTVDEMPGHIEAAGGAARYATEGALAAGLQVTLHTVSGDEPIVRDALDRLATRAIVVRQAAPASIRFEHHRTDESRSLRLLARTDPIASLDPVRLPKAAAVLFAPVAEEVAAGALDGVPTPYRAAGLQGWLRDKDSDGWVVNRPLAALEASLVAALRGLDLLIASHHDLGAPDGPSALAAFRAWAGPDPELVVTTGTDGAWLDDGLSPPVHVPAAVVTERNTIGAGDAFAAVLSARRGAGLDLRSAAAEATTATARYLASRETTP